MLSFAEGRQVGVDSGGDGALVPKINLDLTEVLALLKQMRRIGMTQAVNMGCLLDAAGLEGLAKGQLQGRAAHGLGGRRGALTAVTFGREKQGGMAVGFPERPEQNQRALRQRHVAITIAFASADVDEHALGIDIAYLQPQALAQTQSTGVDGR